MKSTTEYINILRDYMAKNASKYSITRIGIFGSVARGEQTENSDVDVYLETSKPNMFALVHRSLAWSAHLPNVVPPSTE